LTLSSTTLATSRRKAARRAGSIFASRSSATANRLGIRAADHEKELVGGRGQAVGTAGGRLGARLDAEGHRGQEDGAEATLHRPTGTTTGCVQAMLPLDSTIFART
jgi:hypothetical protein